jgi:murein DD-endopeptidase MepM/ murein hydrolase activator NlpD
VEDIMLQMRVARTGLSLIRRLSLLAPFAVLPTVWLMGTPSQAQQDQKAAPKRAQIDWQAAARDAEALSPQLSASADSKELPEQHARKLPGVLEKYTVKERMLPLAHLSALTEHVYSGIAAIPIPALAPIDTTRFLSARVEGGRFRPVTKRTFLGESIESMEVLPGRSGYDAIVTVSSSMLRELGIAEKLKPQLHIGGSALIYGSAEDGEIVADLQGQYPGLRRLLGADEVTYTFRKYEVPYFINVACSNAPPTANSLACTQADAIVRVVLRDLRLIGGGPLANKASALDIAPQLLPAKTSSDFKYFPPGKLISGTSEGNKGASPSREVYGDNLLFPIKNAPAFANSQVFLHGGNCLEGNKIDLPRQPGDNFDRYKCRQNPDKELLNFEGHADNYGYPWRDNLCEARGESGPPECPVQKGHSGQDIRPGKCIPEPGNKARCKIDIFEVVAIIDGKAWWKTGEHENHVRLMYDDPANKFYYMYLHMSPKSLKEAGLKRGETVAVKAGRVIGKVGNFEKSTPGGTTAHLHFEIRRGDNIGKPLSPYMTLIRAYERLIGASGTEITD